MPDTFGSDVWGHVRDLWIYVNDVQPFGLLLIAGFGILLTMGIIRLIWEAFS